MKKILLLVSILLLQLLATAQQRAPKGIEAPLQSSIRFGESFTRNERAAAPNSILTISESLIPGNEYEMGDHFGFVDPNHPSDELPVHLVKVDSFYMATTETSNQQFLDYLNSEFTAGTIEVRNNIVYATGDTNIFYYTNQYASHYSISFNGTTFSMADFRALHPVVGVMWYGAIAYCNWLSAQNGLQPCYNVQTGDCDFSKNGYRLPTEAEWEYAGHGGLLNPYCFYPYGDTLDVNKANLPNSGDPYESGAYPYTTPVGFYDGTLKLKSTYSWPGAATSYQTHSGENAFGLFDMQGNVWELVNDWYAQNYYSQSPYDNPTGPASGFIMPDGRPYRGMRGGNWYNGLDTNGINDGHSRASNRNPSYYRGPQDPNHPWYHVGFRVARKYSVASGVGDNLENEIQLTPNYPNPFHQTTTIRFTLLKAGYVNVSILNSAGESIAVLLNQKVGAGLYSFNWSGGTNPSGVYTCVLRAGNNEVRRKLIYIH